jgi:phosphohistidine phosphatase
MVVGHNPNITTFLVQLISGHNGHESPRNQPRIRLRKGSIARLSMQRGPATLQWLLDPRTVKALYATSTKSSRRKTSRK